MTEDTSATPSDITSSNDKQAQAETEAVLSDAPFNMPTSTVGVEDDESV